MSDIKEFDSIIAAIETFVGPTFEIEVRSPESMAAAMGVARQIKTYEKLVEAKRVELSAPLLVRTREINAKVKGILEPILRAEKHLKAELIAYEQKLAKEREAEFKRLAEERARAEQEINAREQEAKATAALFGASAASDDNAAVARSHIEKQAERIERDIADNRVSGTSKVWKVEITDENQVPREYCDPNMTLLRDAVKRGVREIPGTRIFEETRLAIR